MIFFRNYEYSFKIIIKEMIGLIWVSVKVEKDSWNIYGLVRRYLCIRNKE